VLPASCEIAFKEWSVICHAVAHGQQTIILRKGGIHEGRDGFRVAHRHFWLFPTYLHQEEDRDKVVPEAWPALQLTADERPADERIPLNLLAEVTDVLELHDEPQLSRLAGWHWWSPRTVTERFHYRQSGLFLLLVRIYKTESSVEIPNSPHFAGCRSWVDLPQPLSTAGLTPVIPDGDFQGQRTRILTAISSFSV
jgi:hypothetical protein